MKGEQLVMGKKKDILFEGLGGFDYEKQLSNFRAIIGEEKGNSEYKLNDFAKWNKDIDGIYNSFDSDNKDRFKCAIKTKISYLDNAKDAMTSVTMPVLLLLVPIFVAYLTTTLPKMSEGFASYIAMALSVFYSIFSMVLVLKYAREATAEKRFCEAMLDVVK